MCSVYQARSFASMVISNVLDIPFYTIQYTVRDIECITIVCYLGFEIQGKILGMVPMNTKAGLSEYLLVLFQCVL